MITSETVPPFDTAIEGTGFKENEIISNEALSYAPGGRNLADNKDDIKSKVGFLSSNNAFNTYGDFNDLNTALYERLCNDTLYIHN